MTTKHTQNNWYISTTPRRDAEIQISANGTPQIALVTLRDVSINEQKANARLIAAAPAMLERLRVTALYLDRAIIALQYSNKENDRALAKLLHIERDFIISKMEKATSPKEPPPAAAKPPERQRGRPYHPPDPLTSKEKITNGNAKPRNRSRAL